MGVLTGKRSKKFVEIVERFNKDDPHQVTADETCQAYARSNLPKNPKARKMELVKVYTGNSVYQVVNQCLREDDEKNMRSFAGFIHELRDVFRTDDPNSILQHFQGIVYRGITVLNPKSYLGELEKAQEFVWPAFTSTSTRKAFSGNVRFEIKCSLGTDSAKAEYAPAKIAHLSQYPSEEEVLFPPHVKFRVVNLNGAVLQLETMELPTV